VEHSWDTSTQEVLIDPRQCSRPPLIVFDEIYGFLPPHPANPPTKRPLVALMKQARAFGAGVLVATQNPMDLDYRALSNAGLWSSRIPCNGWRIGGSWCAIRMRLRGRCCFSRADVIVDAGADDSRGGAAGEGVEEAGGGVSGSSPSQVMARVRPASPLCFSCSARRPRSNRQRSPARREARLDSAPAACTAESAASSSDSRA
jgi:hypothetical protein